MMQALRKQEFTRRKPRPTAAEVMGSIRQRFARPAEEMQDRIPRDEAAARTYAPEAMAQPEWKTRSPRPESRRNRRGMCRYTKRSAAICRLSAAALRRIYRKATRRSRGYDPYGGYAAPYPPAGYEPYAAPYPPQGYAAPAYGAPYYDPYAAPAYDPRYNAPLSPERILRAAARLSTLPAAGFRPAPEAPYAPPQPEMPRAPQPEYESAFTEAAFPRRRAIPRRRTPQRRSALLRR